VLPPTVKAERTAAPAPPHDQNKEAEQQFHLTFDRRDYVAIALLVLGVAAMFWRVLFTSQMFYFRDVYNYTYPHVKFIHDAICAGYLPYWNPLLNYGEPVLADPNFLFFYPTTLLIALLPLFETSGRVHTGLADVTRELVREALQGIDETRFF
jgi:hypothetical protein